MNSKIRPLLTPRDTARLLGVSLTTLRRITAAGRIPAPVRISDRRLGYRPDDLETFMAARAGGGR